METRNPASQYNCYNEKCYLISKCVFFPLYIDCRPCSCTWRQMAWVKWNTHVLTTMSGNTLLSAFHMACSKSAIKLTTLGFAGNTSNRLLKTCKFSSTSITDITYYTKASMVLHYYKYTCPYFYNFLLIWLFSSARCTTKSLAYGIPPQWHAQSHLMTCNSCRRRQRNSVWTVSALRRLPSIYLYLFESSIQ